MIQNSRLSRVTLSIVVAGSMAALCGAPAMATDTFDQDDYNVIRLVFTVDVNGQPFVAVNPVRTKLWRESSGRPWMIRWRAANNSPYGDLYWEVRYDSDSDAASQDYFGDIDIACGERGMDVVPKMKPEEPKAEWPFKVTVFLCADGVKGPAKATFEANPKIIWRD